MHVDECRRWVRPGRLTDPSSMLGAVMVDFHAYASLGVVRIQHLAGTIHVPDIATSRWALQTANKQHFLHE